MPFAKRPKIDFSSRDWLTIINDFIRPGGYLETRFGAQYTEFKDTEIGAALIELQAAIGDTFNFQCDVEANESTLLTCTQIQNAIDHVLSIGYVPKGPTASVCPILITMPDYTPQYIFAAGRGLLTDPQFGPVQRFEVRSDIIKVNGANQALGFAVAGTSSTDPTFVSNGDITQQVEIQQSNVVDGSIVVTVDGIQWAQVTDFSQNEPADQVFRIVIQEEIPGDRRSFVEFGDNITGAYPSAGANVVVSYRIGGGTATNIQANQIIRFETAVQDPTGNPIFYTVTNTSDAIDGTDGDDIDTLRITGPSTIRTNNRLVSNQDYVDAALACGAIRAKAITNNEWSAVDENTVLVFVALSLSVPTTKDQAQGIRAQMITKFPGRDTRRLVVVPCTLMVFSPTILAFMNKTADPTVVTPDLASRLAAFYAADSIVGNPPRFVVDIGRPIRLSNLIDQVEETPGISYTEIGSPTEDFVPGPYVLPQIDTTSWTIVLDYDPTQT